jgi:hypothetical protein
MSIQENVELLTNLIVDKNIRNKNIIKKYNNLKNLEYIKHEELKFDDIQETEQNKEYLSKSKEFFYSIVTLSDWTEEINNNNFLGFVFQMNTSYLSHILPFKYNPVIKNFSVNFTTYETYINQLLNNYSPNINNKNIFNGNGFADNCNAMLPLYIHENHWKVVKMHLHNLLGILICHDPRCYKKDFKYIYFIILHEMILVMNENNNLYSNKFITLFFALWRTCCHICSEEKIYKGIKYYRPSKDKYNIYIAQSMSTNYLIDIEDYTDNDNIKLFYFKFMYIINKYGFKKLLKILDNNFGIVPEDIILELKN